MECGGSDTIKVMGPKEFISSNSNIETTTAPKMGQLQFDCYFCFVSLVSCVYKNFPHFFVFVNILDPAKGKSICDGYQTIGSGFIFHSDSQN